MLHQKASYIGPIRIFSCIVKWKPFSKSAISISFLFLLYKILKWSISNKPGYISEPSMKSNCNEKLIWILRQVIWLVMKIRKCRLQLFDALKSIKQILFNWKLMSWYQFSVFAYVCSEIDGWNQKISKIRDFWTI